jgi:hypothetical protein
MVDPVQSGLVGMSSLAGVRIDSDSWDDTAGRYRMATTAVNNETFRENIKKARDVTLVNCFDLMQIYEVDPVQSGLVGMSSLAGVRIDSDSWDDTAGRT